MYTYINRHRAAPVRVAPVRVAPVPVRVAPVRVAPAPVWVAPVRVAPVRVAPAPVRVAPVRVAPAPVRQHRPCDSVTLSPHQKMTHVHYLRPKRDPLLILIERTLPKELLIVLFWLAVDNAPRLRYSLRSRVPK